MSGCSNNMFDMNHDGKLDAGEQFFEFMVFNEMMKEEDKEGKDDDDWGLDFGDDNWCRRRTRRTEPKMTKPEKTLEELNENAETAIAVFKGIICILCVVAIIVVIAVYISML